MSYRCEDPGATLRAMPNRRAGSAGDHPRRGARHAAKSAGLRYADSNRPGFNRRRSGRGFTYLDQEGKRIRDTATIARIRSLAIPPAWTDVWICPDPDGHLQASGRDARGRKQYRYHADWRASRSDAKFERLLDVAAALPRIRRRCERDLARRALSREKVLAAVVRLLELSLIRVGNDEYARLNRSFGLTTLRNQHVKVHGATVRFRFRGKSGRIHEVGLRDRRLASIVRRCQELPGQELFQYVDEAGQPHNITSDDVNAYLRDAAKADVTTRDFRIWAGTVLAYRALAALDPAADQQAARRNVLEAIRISAARLGNTETVARTSYIHPGVLEAYLDGSSNHPRQWTRNDADAFKADTDASYASAIDHAAESAVIALLASLEETR